MKEAVQIIPKAYAAPTPQPPAKKIDYDPVKLCRAIAGHETSHCTTGVGPTHNNCVGMKPGGQFKRYETQEDSILDCARVWQAYYGRFPDLALARKWSGNDRAEKWLSNVKWFYSKL